MPLPLSSGAPTLVVKKAAFERSGITRAQIDQALTLTDEEFRVEHGLVAIGPIFDESGFAALMEAFEQNGLVYFDDFFEMSGNWPEWLSVFTLSRGNRAGGCREGCSSPSHPHTVLDPSFHNLPTFHERQPVLDSIDHDVRSRLDRLAIANDHRHVAPPPPQRGTP